METVGDYISANPEWIKGSRGRLRVITDTNEKCLICPETFMFADHDLVERISKFELVEVVSFGSR